ncbi:MAG: type II toxin-antitoxin system VapC family toxin [Bacteroidetes bacterium]|nr:type II toxin-antitoxin system VapC family toxin [Bacteroidota bacterium]
MSGSRFLLDTNIVLRVLNGNEGLNNLLDDQDLYLAQISQLELLSYPKITETETLSIQRFIAQMPIVEINATIMQETIRLRKTYNIGLPDAIIAASALFLDIPLITTDKGFKRVEKEIELYLYTL